MENRDLISSLEFAHRNFTAIKEERNMKTCRRPCSHSCRFCFFRCHESNGSFSIEHFLVVAFEIINSLLKMVDLAIITFPCWLKNAKDMAGGISSLFCSLNRRIDFSPTNLGFIILNSKRKL